MDLNDAQRSNYNKIKSDNINYITRRVLPDESEEISKCAYSTYGYTYVYEDIYYPDRIKKMNESNELISYVAVTDTNEIVGHSALRFKDKSYAELLAAFTKPKYRGLSCLNSIVEQLLLVAENYNLTGVYVNAICAHLYSQKSAYKYGFKECALLLSRYDSMNLKDIRSDLPIRETVLLSFKYLKRNIELRLYAPNKYRSIIRRIYEQFDIDVKFIASKGISLELDETKYTIEVDSSKVGFINIVSYGKDIASVINKEVKKLCCKGIETIYMKLDLENINTPMIVNEIEDSLFFFSGVMPGERNENRLVLQYLNNRAIDYSSLHVNSEMGKLILKYVENDDPNISVLEY